LNGALQQAHERCEAAKKAEIEREQLQALIRKDDEALGRGRRELDAAESNLADLFHEAEADNEAAFRRRLEIYNERKLIKGTLAEQQRAIALRLGVGERAERLRVELAAADPEHWRAELADLAASLNTLQEERDHAIERRRDAVTARQDLESSTQVLALESDLEQIRAQMAAAAHQWRAISLAEALIQRTLERFERDRQPAVLTEASKRFAAVTDGIYTHVRRSERADDRGLVVVDRDGGAREAEKLSRGTREQLYLCVRLGLCREFAVHSPVLPLIMDDVMVNFDTARAEKIGQLLVAASHEQQILLCIPPQTDHRFHGKLITHSTGN
jgi:uncharacterized protein YhaN